MWLDAVDPGLGFSISSATSWKRAAVPPRPDWLRAASPATGRQGVEHETPGPSAIERYPVRCESPLWARGGHGQTLWSHVLPAPAPEIEPGEVWARRAIELEDGEALVAMTRGGTSGVRVHLFHGLTGDTSSDYMRRAAALLARAGHEVWAVNHRGCGAGQELATKPYHSGKVEDMQAVLRASRDEAPDRKHLVLGFSLSGNIALLLAGQGLDPLPDGVLAINPPVDLARASVDINRGLNRLYELRFMHRLRRAVILRNELRAKQGRPESALKKVPLSMSLCEFDDNYTAPEAGFADGNDYYRRASSLPHLASIATPTVILTAADDPFVDPRAYDGAPRSAHVHLHIEASGGHVGYLTRRGLGWSRWLDGAVEHYTAQLCRLNLRRG